MVAMTPELESDYAQEFLMDHDSEAAWDQWLKVTRRYWAAYIEDTAPMYRSGLWHGYLEIAKQIEESRDAWRSKPENLPRPSGLSKEARARPY